MASMVWYGQWVFDLHPRHADDHMDSLLNLELSGVFLANVFYQLFHFELRKHHCYLIHQSLQSTLYGLI
eukprot:scaffold362145_cov1089-Cyclotella_meneghiniana.AAC.3